MSRFDRWSRRKRGEPLSEQDVAEPGAAQAPSTEAPGEVAGDAEPPAPGSLDHTLPDPDTLPPGSDIKAYLASGVSHGLRKRALRRLFAADHYGIRDGLDDYDDDYRQTIQPLASDVAERLRSWTRKTLDADDESGQDAAAPSPDSAPADVAERGDGHEPSAGEEPAEAEAPAQGEAADTQTSTREPRRRDGAAS